MLATTSLMLFAALAAAQALTVDQFDERIAANQAVVDARVSEFQSTAEVVIANLCTEFGLDDCNDRNAATATAATAGDEAAVRVIFEQLLLDGTGSALNALVDLAANVATAKEENDVEAHAAAVDAFAAQLDVVVQNLLTRSAVLVDDAKTAADDVRTQAAAALEAARTRLEAFDGLAVQRAELAELVAEAEAAKKDNAAIAALQKAIDAAAGEAATKAAIADVRAKLGAGALNARGTLVQTVLADAIERATAFRLDAAAAPADEEAAAEGDEEAELSAAEAASFAVHLVHAVLAPESAADFEAIGTAAEAYADLAFETVTVDGAVTYEVLCAADHDLEAEPNQNCVEQLANLAADTTSVWTGFNVLAAADLDVALEEGEALDGWQAPDAWATTKAAATKKPSGGYGNNDHDDEAEQEEEEEDDAASLAGLSLGALAAALYAKLF